MVAMVKRSVITLYSGNKDIHSHRVRIVLAEKGVYSDVLHVDLDHLPEDLLDLNPYGTVPTLVDRDLILYEPNVILEYLDERFPHPPLLPVYPVYRAKSRLMIHRIEKDWYPLVHRILDGTSEELVAKAREELRDAFVLLVPVFAEYPYFLSSDFSLVDCAIGPLLWRFSDLGIELPSKARPILDYAHRVFKRPSFQRSLTEYEQSEFSFQ